MREGVADERVEALVVDLDVEDAAAARGHDDRLHAALGRAGHVAVHPGAVEDRADDVEVRCRASARRRRRRSGWSRPGWR